MKKILVIITIVLTLLAGSTQSTASAQIAPLPDFEVVVGDAHSQTIYGLYKVWLGRTPDKDGFNYWMQFDDPIAISEAFQSSAESTRIGLQGREWLKWAYQNAFNRAPDPEGLQYWETVLATQGQARVAVWLAQSDEIKNLTPFIQPPGEKYIASGISITEYEHYYVTFAHISYAELTVSPEGLAPVGSSKGIVEVNGNWFTETETLGRGMHEGVPYGTHQNEDETLWIAGDSIWISSFDWAYLERDYAVSGHPRLVFERKPVKHFSYDPVMYEPHRRTAIGISLEYVILIVSKDTGRFTALETAEILVEHGAYTGLMLDGGRSSQMAVRGEPVVHTGRDVMNRVVIY